MLSFGSVFSLFWLPGTLLLSLSFRTDTHHSSIGFEFLIEVLISAVVGHFKVFDEGAHKQSVHDGLRVSEHVEDLHAPKSVLELGKTDFSLVAWVSKLLHPLLKVYDVDVPEFEAGSVQLVRRVNIDLVLIRLRPRLLALVLSHLNNQIIIYSK